MMKQPALGNTISALRNQKGMTQKELADACAVDIRTIQRIEAGEVSPRMHTLRLLAKALDCDAGALNPPATENNVTNGAFNSQLRLPFLAGITYSINAILIAFDLITHSLNLYFHTCAILVHIGSCLFFLRGFHLIGRQNNNQLMDITSLLAMVLLPLINILYLLKLYYITMGALFVLLCVNEIVRGISFWMEGHKRKGPSRVNLYKTAGLMMIIQAIMYLSLDTPILNTGLIISLFCNAIATTILYLEYKGDNWQAQPADTAGRRHSLTPSATKQAHL